MTAGADFDVSQIVSNLYRRKGLIVSAFVVFSLLGGYLASVLPNVYRSSSLILITPQRVPISFVASTVTADLGERMESSIREILSRTQLEKIIHEYDLYPSETKGSISEDRIESLRRSIKVEFRKNNIFQLSFESLDPEKSKQVTGRLAALFIEQNLHVREQQAHGTRSFINMELERLRKELEEQEAVVSRYKAANRFELPEQLETNLRSLEQFRRELDSSSHRLSALQERRGVLQKQAVESDILKLDLPGSPFAISGDGVTQDVQRDMKKKELDSLLQRYSSKHPDVIRLKKEIQALEVENVELVPSKRSNSPKVANLNPVKEVLRAQIVDIDSEMQVLRSQSDRIRSQIGILQSRVDNTSTRSIELSKISRGYDITLRKYQDLLGKSLESELSENMEKKQKGEQFQIVDAANFPLKPIRPNRLLVVLAGLLTGIASGVALALLWDNLDTSFKRSDEIKGSVNVPLLATIPSIITRSSVLEQRRTQGLLVLASIGTLAVGLVCVRLFGPLYF